MLVVSLKNVVRPSYWLHTVCLWSSFCTHQSLVCSVVACLVFLLHLSVEFFSFLEDLHQLAIHFITVQRLQDVLLVLELVRRLFGLLSPLLFLNHRVCIFWFAWLFLRVLSKLGQVLTMTLCSRFALRLCIFTPIGTLWSLVDLLLLLVANWKALLGSLMIIDYLHRQNLVRQLVLSIPRVLLSNDVLI